MMKEEETRPSVNYAKDWLDQLLLIPLEKGIIYGCDHNYGSVNNHFPVLGHFRHGDDNQPGDPRASLL